MTVLLRYSLEEEIGRGATGTVFRARERGTLGRTVAVKRVRAGRAGTAEVAWREARLLAVLDHPHVVRVYDVVRDGPGTAVVMAYAPGGSLGRRLDEHGSLAAPALARLVLPIADALSSAHRLGIVHGDVKPANILFTSDGEPLLSDFGAARWLDDAAAGAIAVGTVGYLDPELLYGPAVDVRSDVYSLAVTCFESLAGMLPFASTRPEEVLALADRGHTLSLEDHAPEVPRSVAEVVHRAMARRPDERFASVETFAAALRDALPGPSGGSAPAATSRGAGTPPAPPSGRPRGAEPGQGPRQTRRRPGRAVPRPHLLVAALVVAPVLEMLLLAPPVARTLVIVQVPFALALTVLVAATAGVGTSRRRAGPSRPRPDVTGDSAVGRPGRHLAPGGGSGRLSVRVPRIRDRRVQ